jgi:hypothetical protein
MLYGEACVRNLSWTKYNKFYTQDNGYSKSDEFRTPEI